MNVYDFDKTIYYPDSSYSFFLYCLKHYPGAVLRTLPQAVIYSVRYACKSIRTKELKEQLFSFLRFLPDPEQTAERFWDEHFSGIGSWYLAQKKPDDLIISAAPELLVRVAAKRLGVSLLATKMDPFSGRIEGENCHDREKVRRFFSAYPAGKIQSFYSDSLSDGPLAALADKAFLVSRGKLSAWPEA